MIGRSRIEKEYIEVKDADGYRYICPPYAIKDYKKPTAKELNHCSRILTKSKFGRS